MKRASTVSDPAGPARTTPVLRATSAAATVIMVGLFVTLAGEGAALAPLAATIVLTTWMPDLPGSRPRSVVASYGLLAVLGWGAARLLAGSGDLLVVVVLALLISSAAALLAALGRLHVPATAVPVLLAGAEEPARAALVICIAALAVALLLLGRQRVRMPVAAA